MDRLLVALTIFVPRGASMHANFPDSSTYTSADPKDLRRTFQIRMAALTCSTISLAASIVVLYWFCRMKKRFRHRLIILLLWGDLMRTIWFFLFIIISSARGTIKTHSAFCQASGFLVQYGTETSDYAVLVIAIHSALQIFQPSTQTTSDGLYPYQRYVYTAAVLIPIVMSSLAFINSHSGYSSLGAFCTLPIRPFWYRIALTWIPRYLIATIIIGLAVAIYAYVGLEFRSYSETIQSMRNSCASTLPQDLRHERDEEAAIETPKMMEQKVYQQHRASSIAHDILSSHRGNLSVSVESVRLSAIPMSLDPSTSTQSLPINTRHHPLNPGARVRPPLSVIPSSSSIQPTYIPIATYTSPVTTNPLQSNPSTPLHTSSPLSTSPSLAQNPLSLQRARIHRHLRLLFIYPLAYTLMWLLPFVLHCMMYTDKYALRPLWFLRLGATICVSSMGFVDCLIFSLRERPWRSVGKTGTFWGSFVVGRICERDDESRKVEEGKGEGGENLGTERRKKMRGVTKSEGVDEYVSMAASQARLRLHLEREERFMALEAGAARCSGSVDGISGCDDSSGSHYSEGGSGVLNTGVEETDIKGKGKAKATEGAGEPSSA